MKNIHSLVERARESSVGIILINGLDLKSNRRILKLGEKYKEVKCALGIYPIEALKLSEKEIDKEITFIRENKDKIIAIGEVGIDLKWSSELELQEKIFRKFVRFGKELNLPLIIHSRNAEKRVIEILEEEKAKKVIMHCFSGGIGLINRVLDNKWFLSIPTNVVYSEQMQKLVLRVPINQLLCETDSPYLHPFKEKNNEPCFVIESYKKIAELKRINLSEVENQIEKNFNKIFNNKL
jgi:TatD DNase family protein